MKMIDIYIVVIFSLIVAADGENNLNKNQSAIPLSISELNIFDEGSDIKLTRNSTLLRPSEADVKYYMNFSAAAYCDKSVISNFSCFFCKIPNVRLIKLFYSSAYNTQAFLTVNRIRRELVIAFRGSYNLQNVLVDLESSLVPFEIQQKRKILIHTGFYDATTSLFGSLSAEIRRQLSSNNGRNFNGYKLVLTGHSLGGAMAMITLSLWTSDNAFQTLFQRNNIKLALFTYGQPRVGNQEFVNYINSLRIPVARVTGADDFVPHMFPVSFGYLHHQNEFWIGYNGRVRFCGGNNVYENPNCSNSVGPFYNIFDHIFGYFVDITQCVEQSPLEFLEQFFGY